MIPGTISDGHVNQNLDNYTGWQLVTVPGSPASSYKGWKCKRPGVWRITTTAFCNLMSPSSLDFAHGMFALSVQVIGGVGVARSHIRTVTRPPGGSGNVIETAIWVDYLQVGYDNISTFLPSAESRKITSFTASTTNSQDNVLM